MNTKIRFDIGFLFGGFDEEAQKAFDIKPSI